MLRKMEHDWKGVGIYHIYREIWLAAVGEVLVCKRGEQNATDWHARGTEWSSDTYRERCPMFTRFSRREEEPSHESSQLHGGTKSARVKCADGNGYSLQKFDIFRALIFENIFYQ